MKHFTVSLIAGFALALAMPLAAADGNPGTISVRGAVDAQGGPNQIGWSAALASSDSRERFLAVERFARLAQAEQSARLSDLYVGISPRSLGMFVEGVLSSYPHDILNRRTGVYDGHTQLWAQQR